MLSSKISYNENMLMYGKYLKELGYKRGDFPFEDGAKDSRFKLDKKRGVVEAQTWNLYNTIILELYTYLRYFQECCPKGIPFPYVDDSKEDQGLSDWEAVVQEIIDGLKAYIEAENLDCGSDIEKWRQERDALFAKFDKGWALLGENIRCFWW